MRPFLLRTDPLFRALVLLAWCLTLVSACKSGLPAPQDAIRASARLVSISPKAATPDEIQMAKEERELEHEVNRLNQPNQ